MEIEFEVHRSYKPNAGLKWSADIWEIVPGGGWEGATAKTFKCQAIALTRIGLYFEVKRKCRNIKKSRKQAAQPPKGRKTWKVKV